MCRDSYSQFAEELAGFVSGLRLGNGLNEGVDIGPMLRAPFRQKVERHIADATARGAQVLVGGSRPSHFEHGFFLEPAVLVNVDHSMAIMREETFGPALHPLMPYGDFDEAIRLCNDSQFGAGRLPASHEARLVKRFFEDVEAGTIWINDLLTDNYAGPFGGMKMTRRRRKWARRAG